MIAQDLSSIIQGIDSGLEKLALIKPKTKTKLSSSPPSLISPPLTQGRKVLSFADGFSFIRYDPFIWIPPKKNLVVEPGFNTPWILFPQEDRETKEFIREIRQRAKTLRLFSETGCFYYNHIPNLVSTIMAVNKDLIESDNKELYDLLVDKVGDGRLRLEKSRGLFEIGGKTYLEKVAEAVLFVKLKELVKSRSNFTQDLERHLGPLKRIGFDLDFLNPSNKDKYTPEWANKVMFEDWERRGFQGEKEDKKTVDGDGFDWGIGEFVKV